MENMDNFVIRTSGLSKSYKNVAALKPLDLKVQRNSIFGFLGPNGAGKTTTIKLLLGLVRPSAGSATVFGYDMAKDSIEIRRRVGYLAQNPRYYDHMTARQTLEFTARFFYKGSKSELGFRVAETLGLVGLIDKADRPIKGFSGGELQRLGIAQAQVNYPDLLILDEPAASLDPMGRRDVLEVMERLREHTTIFYSTHILDDVQRVSDTVAILNHGQLVAHAPIEELLAGSGELTYSIVIKGRADSVYERVAAQSWVSAIKTSAAPQNGGQHQWQVSVTDQEAAEAQLLQLLLGEESVTVVEFGRKQYNLEEVFMNIVDEANHG